MQVITILLVLSLSFSIMAQTTSKNQIENLNKTKQRLESAIKVKQDSLKLINQKIDLITQEEFVKKLKKQPEGMVIKGIITIPGKIRKENNPNSIVLTEVSTSDTVLLTDYIDDYWVVNKGKYFGYINDMYIKKSPDIIAFKKSLFDRKVSMRLQKEKENRIKDLANTKERRNFLVKKYGKEDGERISSGHFWIGMTSEMARESLGNPETINKSVGSWGIHEQWVYYDDYLYFENGILTSYQISK